MYQNFKINPRGITQKITPSNAEKRQKRTYNEQDKF